jgi:hypothetical protein
VVRPGEIDHLKCKSLYVKIAHVSEGDRQSDLPEGNGLLSRDHFIEQVWAALELVEVSPSSSKVSRYMKLRPLPPIHEGLGEPGCPDQWVDYEGKPPQLRDAI